VFSALSPSEVLVADSLAELRASLADSLAELRASLAEPRAEVTASLAELTLSPAEEVMLPRADVAELRMSLGSIVEVVIALPSEEMVVTMAPPEVEVTVGLPSCDIVSTGFGAFVGERPYRAAGDVDADAGAKLEASADQGFLIIASASLASAVTETIREVWVLAQALEIAIVTAKLASLVGTEHAGTALGLQTVNILCRYRDTWEYSQHSCPG
jgi:hypothetical protein